jgi:hypothetical protein
MALAPLIGLPMGIAFFNWSAGSTMYTNFVMVVSVGPYRFTSLPASLPAASYHFFTSAGSNGSPDNKTC